MNAQRRIICEHLWGHTPSTEWYKKVWSILYSKNRTHLDILKILF